MTNTPIARLLVAKSSMSLDTYQDHAGTTAVYPERGTGSQAALNYALAGLAGEAGEVMNKWKKVLRGDRSLGATKAALVAELGGVLWYLAAAATELGISLEAVAKSNLDELAARAAFGVIQGDGDTRGADAAVEGRAP